MPGVGFAVGAAKTTQLDQKRQPAAYTAGVSGTFAACRSTANAERNYEGGRTSTWLRADLAGGYVPNKWWVACCSCWAPGHRSTTASGCALLSPRSGIVLGRRNWPPVPGCWTGSATRWAEGVLASSPRRFSWNSRAGIFAQRCEDDERLTYLPRTQELRPLMCHSCATYDVLLRDFTKKAASLGRSELCQDRFRMASARSTASSCRFTPLCQHICWRHGTPIKKW